MDGHFGDKAGDLDPVDGRPREFNTPADLVADCAIATKSDMDTLRRDEIYRHVQIKGGLQVFTDGGFTGECGAAAFVIV